MVWKINYVSELQIVELIFSGQVTGPELQHAAAARIDFGQAKGASKYLIDAQEMRAESSLTLDVIDIPAVVYYEKKMDRRSRIAVVSPRDPDSRWISRFYEDASANRGWRVRTFGDRESALDWLQNPG